MNLVRKSLSPRYRAALASLALLSCPATAEPLQVSIGLISQPPREHIPLSSLEPAIEGDGREGALQGIRDNNTTGRFTGQSFSLQQLEVGPEVTAPDALRALRAQGVGLILTDLPAQDLLALADLPEAEDMVLMNVGSRDDRLRTEACRSNLLHTAPSRAMIADALAQYLAWKRWQKWFLVVGPHPEDQAYAAAIRRSAKRFGAKVVVEKPWTFEAGATRTDSGHFNEQQLANTFTQVDDYDVLVVADEADELGEYLRYRTFRPRPVVGTQGLVAAAWSDVTEQWGATQFQRRFREKTGRFMTPLDYAAWVAVRSIGEAATRAQSAEPRVLRDYMLSAEFELAAFKGVPVSFRDWNGQLREPILISSSRVLVSVSPQEGFLHQFSTLDTLGYDRSETRCDRR